MDVVSSDGGSRRRRPKSTSSTRYSILSDPRLSQLFDLSSQLEALAETAEIRRASSAAAGDATKAPPSKQAVVGSKTPNGNQPLLAMTSSPFFNVSGEEEMAVPNGNIEIEVRL